jgi:septum formation protein
VEFILASSSPRRRALLEELGLALRVQPADIDETPFPNEPAHSYVERLAREKAETVVGETGVVIAADTIVTIDGELLGKPATDDDARRFLLRLSGRSHEVKTGVAIRHAGRTSSVVETTIVHFAELSDDDIAWYVGTGETTDKAGAYAIQGRGGAFISKVEGSFDNVIGLPRHALRGLLRDRDFDLLPGTI